MTVSPLREGAVVGLGGPVGLGVHDPDVGGVAEVRVVGGPDAGRVHRLPLGEFVLGSAHDADAYVADGSVSARQARLQVTPQEVRWTPYDGAAAASDRGPPADRGRGRCSPGRWSPSAPAGYRRAGRGAGRGAGAERGRRAGLQPAAAAAAGAAPASRWRCRPSRPTGSSGRSRCWPRWPRWCSAWRCS